MRQIVTYLIVLVILIPLKFFGQEYSTGLLLEEKYFENSAESAPLMRGDYGNLPESVSLIKFTPTSGSQGSYGTCTGWSTAYSARTILEAMKNNWNKSTIDSNVFSPSYVYNQIRKTDNCFGGASLIDALDVLKNKGGLKLKEFNYDCDRKVVEKDNLIAKDYTIIEYRELADRFTKAKAIKVKKSLSEMKPVVIAIDMPKSLYRAKELWTPKKTDYKRWGTGHALTVIGYDNNKFGGAFHLQNSWGKNWGKNGYVWMKYSDFEYFCLYAFELISKEYDKERQFDLSGTLKFITSDGEPMRSSFDGKMFNMEQSYVSGTLFQLFISNNQPAYVYAFGTDLTNKTYKIFPFHDKMLAYLPYKNNNIAIPDEGSYTMFDENTGTTFYCFIYSKERLDINAILNAYEELNKPIIENLDIILGKKVIKPDKVNFLDGETISFKAKSDISDIVLIVVKIYHKS